MPKKWSTNADVVAATQPHLRYLLVGRSKTVRCTKRRHDGRHRPIELAWRFVETERSADPCSRARCEPGEQEYTLIPIFRSCATRV